MEKGLQLSELQRDEMWGSKGRTYMQLAPPATSSFVFLLAHTTRRGFSEVYPAPPVSDRFYAVTNICVSSVVTTRTLRPRYGIWVASSSYGLSGNELRELRDKKQAERKTRAP